VSVERERSCATALAAWNSEEEIHTQVTTSWSQLQVRLDNGEKEKFNIIGIILQG
jgi:hypothetical protein